MVEKWYTVTWSDNHANKVYRNFPNVSITGHFPSQRQIRFMGPAEDIENLLNKLQN